MGHGFPPEFQHGWVDDNTERLSGPYRGVPLIIDHLYLQPATLADSMARTDQSILQRSSRYRLLVSVPLTAPCPLLSIASREHFQEDLGPPGPPAYPLIHDIVDYDTAYSVGYPPFDDHFFVSSPEVSFLRTLMHPDLLRWMVAVSTQVSWHKVVFFEQRAWLLHNSVELDPPYVLGRANYLLDLLGHVQDIVRVQPLGPS